ncbi:MAG TPA: alpha/beta family hydrolase [Vicinamibacterales bacterium]|nr:alpha/beta family hydrolase [Vicinamibacterales bacterium]
MPAGGEFSVYPAAPAARATLLLAHGAGAGRLSPFMVQIGRLLAARGLLVGAFDFPYMAARRKVPDRGPVLEQAWREAIAAWRQRPDAEGLPLFIGGKSMGARIASHVAAGDDAVDVAGLVFLGYPLHPPGKPDQRRDAHLPAIAAPMLFVQGGRDPFGTADEIRALLPRLRQPTLHVVEDGDHSFKMRKRSTDDVMAEVADTVARWIGSRA